MIKEFAETYATIKEVNPLMENVNTCKKIPFFGVNANPLDFDFKSWVNKMYDSNTLLSGGKSYYWQLIKLTNNSQQGASNEGKQGRNI